MVMQDPKFSLNPVMTIGDQIVEAYRLHAGGARAAARQKALDMLAAAERPLIVAGGGIINADASAQLVELAELLDVLVVEDPSLSEPPQAVSPIRAMAHAVAWIVRLGVVRMVSSRSVATDVASRSPCLAQHAVDARISTRDALSVRCQQRVREGVEGGAPQGGRERRRRRCDDRRRRRDGRRRRRAR